MNYLYLLYILLISGIFSLIPMLELSFAQISGKLGVQVELTSSVSDIDESEISLRLDRENEEPLFFEAPIDISRQFDVLGAYEVKVVRFPSGLTVASSGCSGTIAEQGSAFCIIQFGTGLSVEDVESERDFGASSPRVTDNIDFTGLSITSIESEVEYDKNNILSFQNCKLSSGDLLLYKVKYVFKGKLTNKFNVKPALSNYDNKDIEIKVSNFNPLTKSQNVSNANGYLKINQKNITDYRDNIYFNILDKYIECVYQNTNIISEKQPKLPLDSHDIFAECDLKNILINAHTKSPLKNNASKNNNIKLEFSVGKESTKIIPESDHKVTFPNFILGNVDVTGFGNNIYLQNIKVENSCFQP